jgi:hypothetical protein
LAGYSGEEVYLSNNLVPKFERSPPSLEIRRVLLVAIDLFDNQILSVLGLEEEQV